MSFKVFTCYVLSCDECGREFQGLEDVEIHFDDLEAAITEATSTAWDSEDHLVSWVATGDVIRCRRCVGKESCALIGHQPGPALLGETAVCLSCEGRVS